MAINNVVKPKRIIGVDCSTQSFAYGILEDGKLIDFGEIEFDGNTVFDRLADGQSKVRKLNLNADIVVVESAIFVQNKKTVILLAYALGAIISALKQSGMNVIETSPIQWQRVIGNPPLTKVEKQRLMSTTPGRSKTWYNDLYRKERKARTADLMQKRYNISLSNVTDNVTDAIGLATAHYETI